MKKMISSVMAMLMAISLCVPAFAADKFALHPQMGISEMTISELAEAYKNNVEVQPQFEKAVKDAEFLREHISNDAVVQDLSVDALDTLSSIIQANSLTEPEANNLVNTWGTRIRTTNDSLKYIEYARMLDPEGGANDSDISAYAYTGGVTTYANKYDLTGVHYMVRSIYGYNQASGTFTLPTLDIKSSIDDPDKPYGFFGIYDNAENIGIDLGCVYIQEENAWRFFVGGYIKNSLGSYTHYWKVLDEVSYPPNRNYQFNFVATITNETTYDKLSIAIVDASNWSAIGSIELKSNEKGWNSSVTKELPGASRAYTTKDYSNICLNREVTLAHKEKSNRNFTGTTITGAKWSNVYLYNQSININSKWGTAQTKFARKAGETAAYANKVNVSVITKWSEDITNINYSLN